MKCCELIDKITSSLATFGVLISLSSNDDSVIDAKEFHKLQTLYLQVMADVRNIYRKMKVEREENFQKTNSRRNKESKKRNGTNIVDLSFCMLFNWVYYKNNEE